MSVLGSWNFHVKPMLKLNAQTYVFTKNIQIRLNRVQKLVDICAWKIINRVSHVNRKPQKDSFTRRVPESFKLYLNS